MVAITIDNTMIDLVKMFFNRLSKMKKFKFIICNGLNQSNNGLLFFIVRLEIWIKTNVWKRSFCSDWWSKFNLAWLSIQFYFIWLWVNFEIHFQFFFLEIERINEFYLVRCVWFFFHVLLIFRKTKTNFKLII